MKVKYHPTFSQPVSDGAANVSLAAMAMLETGFPHMNVGGDI